MRSEAIWCLYPDREGSVWIGTSGGGLSCWRRGKLDTCTTRQGLVNDVICQILEDDAGHLWLGSYGGVFRLHKEEMTRLAASEIKSVQCLAFTELDGLPTIECSGGFQPSGCKSHDGRLWFPTVKGLAVLDPGRMAFNPLPPPVVIEAASLDGTVVTLDQRDETGERRLAGLTVITSGEGMELRLDPGRHRLELRYTALSFTAPQKVRFRHQLEEPSGAWVDAGIERTASYNYLPPGRYRFRVTACNNDGVWNQAGASLDITVLPRFWQTGWFRFAALGLLVALTATLARTVARRRVLRQLERLKHEQALERERIRIARDIHDELGALVTRVGMLAERQGTAQTANETDTQLRQIGETAREMVQAMDATVWAVSPQNDTLNQLADYLQHHAEEFLGQTGLSCHIDMPVEMPDWPITAEVRHNLFLVVKEALNNLVRHAKATQARLELKLTGTRLAITIRDNGRGFDTSATRPRGCGLDNMMQRMAQLGGRLAIQSHRDAGTLITLDMDVRAMQSAHE